MASTTKHLRSSTASKRPTASGLAEGQLAINTASGTPGLFLKDSAGTVVKVGPVHVGAGAPNATPAGSAGNSMGELWVDNSATIHGLNYYTGSAFVNLTPSGTATVAGLVELATDAETQTGTDTVRAVTPSGLQSKVSNSTSTTSSTTIASSTAVKSAYDLANAALPKAGGTVTGALEIGTAGSLVFEGSSDDSFETTLAVVNPTADRTITLPNVTGTVITTGDSGTVTSTMIADDTIVNADISASAGIVDTKLATIATAGKISDSALPATISSSITGNAATATKLSSARTFALTGDVTGSVSSDLTSGASISASIAAGIIDNANISNTAGIVDTKLATIATAGKISDSALPATISSSITGNAATATNCSRSVLAGTNMTGGGALSGNVTLSLSATPSVTTVQHSGNVFSGANDTTIATTSLRSVIGAGVCHLCDNDGAGTSNILTVQRSASGGNVVRFVRGTSSVGTISVTASATSYNETSDYRLKENITPLSDSITRLLQLKPSRFNFIVDPDTVVDGFIAHEAAAVVPESVTGEKDEVDENGDPVHQGIDKSKLVPLLTAALQEAIAKIELLEQRLTAAGIA